MTTRTRKAGAAGTTAAASAAPARGTARATRKSTDAGAGRTAASARATPSAAAATPRTSTATVRGRPAGAASAGASAKAGARAARTATAALRDEARALDAPIDASIVPATRKDMRPAAGMAAGLAPVTRETRWVRQECAMTEPEYAALSLLKKRASMLARPTKRGELLRVGLQWLATLDDAALFDVLSRTPIARR